MQTILRFPRVYVLFSTIISGNVFSVYVKKYVRPKKGDKILDIGCGTAEILSYLPEVEYVGMDINRDYIDYAKKRFGNKGQFLNQKVKKGLADELSLVGFDHVLAKGVLHHLNDDQAIQLFELSSMVLKQGGRLITFDGCYVQGQSWLTRLILSKDRGKYVRTKHEYLGLASKSFKNIQFSIHNDLIRIPYTHIIMECAI